MDAAKNLDGKLETKTNGKVNMMSNSDITNKNKHKNRNSLFFHIPYHPHDVSRRKFNNHIQITVREVETGLKTSKLKMENL